MRLPIILAALALLVAGCGDYYILNPTVDQDVDQQTGTGINTPPPASDAGNGSGVVSGFSCTPVGPSNSTCMLQWSGDPGPFGVLAVRISDDVTSLHPDKGPGTTIDPGVAGQGAGTWNLHLQRSGATIATTSVVLDS